MLTSAVSEASKMFETEGIVIEYILYYSMLTQCRKHLPNKMYFFN